jgi:carboxylesterase type B
MYSGAEMVEFYKGRAIMISINYRLNVFGFLGSEMLRSQDPENGSTGNQGLQDQRLALQWIQRNIGKLQHCYIVLT